MVTISVSKDASYTAHADVQFGAKQKGFTLIELMVTFAIIAILATIGIPAYSDYVKQGKVAEATSTLADLRIRTEQYFQDTRTYVNAPCQPAPGTTEHFDYVCVADATTYTITATGKTNHDLDGFEFTIDQNNIKTSKYQGVSGTNCWITKKGGSC
ncbi:MAG: pilus assembly protein PilE [Methylophilaceae bacterium 17-43-7]|jgi:type IV pilus assembly protein PilE|nr:MAG: pilus assembly protein PilE [Methylophilales bacterium 28-44-11]OYZ08641.1 MAG: pilus assembly protein PilE [Methylophilales bacterium 16-45-7]OYZ70509.1 MAG: pilus assembly protein PilE [Methylophilaceae bacterium 17-43-7]